MMNANLLLLLVVLNTINMGQEGKAYTFAFQGWNRI